jgi:hypothetical protein
VTEWTIAGVPRSAPVTGRVKLPRVGVALTATITAPTAMKTRLSTEVIGDVGPIRVTLNGKQVSGADVSLEKGPNVVAIEAIGPGSPVVFARFHDPDRMLTYPEPAGKK